MATIDLGQFETTVVSAASFGPAFRRVLVHVVHVTESTREERCSCGAVIPVGGELYLVNGHVECELTFGLTRQKLKPAKGFYPEQRFGASPQLQRRRTPWRHRR